MSDIEADVVIVGSGIAGALLADRLALSGVRVAILEAGPRIDRGHALRRYFQAPFKTPESPYEATPAADFPLTIDPGHWYRQSGPDRFKSTYLKAVGGTTWHWLGTCLRLLPNDFRMRSRYGRGVDWPLDYDDLEPFYTQAEREWRAIPARISAPPVPVLSRSRRFRFPTSTAYSRAPYRVPATGSAQLPRPATRSSGTGGPPAAEARPAFPSARFRQSTTRPCIWPGPSAAAPRSIPQPRLPS